MKTAQAPSSHAKAGPVRIGIGGWTYEPWRDNFYPKGLLRKQELNYAAEHLTAIEINGTFYRLQTPATFIKWRNDTPEGFVFSLKAPRYVTHRRVLAQAGEGVEAFLDSGLLELGDKLGPIVWQFPPSKTFEPEDFKAFVQLLPAQRNGQRLRHVLDVRHDSFMSPAYLALARSHGLSTVFADSPDYPSFADLTGDIVYARLMRSQARLKTGYGPAALARWAEAARCWADGGEPADLPRVEAVQSSAAASREVFIFFINGAKERAPAGAMALIKLLSKP